MGPGAITIGLDFDNTLVTYDKVFYRLAQESGLVPPGTPPNKKALRDRIRQTPDGEVRWQKLQALVYGPRMQEAELIDGVRRFIDLARAQEIALVIVSHKTEFANYDETRTDLRRASLDWMTRQSFFEPDGFGFRREDVWFESTRLEKLARIRQLGCTHFVDDLEEVFQEPSFPERTERILFAPHRESSARLPGVKMFTNWQEISAHLFGSVETRYVAPWVV
jgi:hypothetical protein